MQRKRTGRQTWKKVTGLDGTGRERTGSRTGKKGDWKNKDRKTIKVHV